MTSCANYTYLLESGEESSADTSSDTQLSQQLKSNPTASKSSSSDKPTEYYLPSLFSEKSESSTGTSGEERSMSLPGASRVRTFQLLVEALGLQENGRAFGEKWRELSVKYNPDTHSWKTHQCSLLEESEPFSVTWPRWGMMQGGVCWERIMLKRRTKGIESGYWPSPNARDWKDTSASQGNRKSPNLGTVVHWPTPRTKGMCGGTGNWEQLKKKTSIEEARLMGAGNGGQLNPPWVEWLMGWPVGWTDLKPLETDKFQSWQQQHGGF
jgi:hypothetical protein